MAERIVKKDETDVKQGGRPYSMKYVLFGSLALAVVVGIFIMGGFWDSLWN